MPQPLLDIIELSGIMVMVGILIVYSTALFFDLKYIRCAKTANIWIKYLYIAIEIIWIAEYIYVLGKILFGSPVDINFFGIIIVRPTILLTGVVMAFGARNRFNIAKYTGEQPCQSQPKS